MTIFPCLNGEQTMKISNDVMKYFLQILLILFIAVNIQNVHAHKQITVNIIGEINLGNTTDSDSVNFENTSKVFDRASYLFNEALATFTTIGTTFIDPRSNYITNHSNGIKVPSDYAKFLSSNNITAVSTSNMHVGAFGFEGITSTVEALRNYNIEFAGIKSFCETTIFEKGGVKFGFASFGNSPHSPSISDSVKIKQLINNLDNKCDIVVVAFSIKENALHTHTINSTKSTYLKIAEIFAHTCIEEGADIVYGDGINAPSEIELFKDRLIVYGLGKFCTPFGTIRHGEASCSPLIRVNLFSDGTFDNATIHSFRQTDNTGPYADVGMDAIKIIRNKTYSAFTDNLLSISEEGKVTPNVKSNSAISIEILDEGRTHLGKRYVRGTAGPKTFDCSGFTSFIFRTIGIELHRTSQGQYQQGLKISRAELKPGDLVFFQGSASRGIGHVGVVVSVDKKNNSFKFMHAANRGVVIDDFAKASYYIRRYVGATRIIGEIAPSNYNSNNEQINTTI